MDTIIRCNLPNIPIYHIVYTKRTKKLNMYKHNAAIVEYSTYKKISFNTDDTISIYDRVVNLKWYDDTDYICWNYSQRKHIFVKDPVKAIEIFSLKNIKDLC